MYYMLQQRCGGTYNSDYSDAPVQQLAATRIYGFLDHFFLSTFLGDLEIFE
jgi:hypothetical protein